MSFAMPPKMAERLGEVLGLAWVDVDFDRAVVRVWQALQRAGGELRLGPVKTDGSIRFVALPQPCLQALQDHRRRQDLERSRTETESMPIWYAVLRRESTGNQCY